MKIDEIRIYAEVLEQGINFKSYIQKLGYSSKILNIYTKKPRTTFSVADSLIDRIRKVKDVDILVTVISEKKEYPLLLVEYSTAVPTDDHKMQRSDVYFWGAKFRVPIMKISPNTKGMEQDFGGGSKITNELEILLSNKIGAIFYPIEWENCNSSNSLKTDLFSLSCISYSIEIFNILKEIFNVFLTSQNYLSYYDNLFDSWNIQYQNILCEYRNFDLKTLIVNSSRFNWFENKLCVKINRFGHAMDPDRGVLYFVNMLVGADNTIAEIQVNRSKEFNSRGGYKSLFDSSSRETKLKKYVEDIINNRNNKFTIEDALYVFLNGLNIDGHLQFLKVSETDFFIEDNILKTFLLKHPSMTAKSIFYLATELRLTDVNRNIICRIKWNNQIVDEYLKMIACDNYSPLSIIPLNNSRSKEDIVTYACVELYKKLKYKLLAVSYPGAQGDRCMLCGQGRKVLRTYVDIITYKNDGDNFKVFLQECKESFKDCKKDVKKLRDICDNSVNKNALFELFEKASEVSLDDSSEIYLSVAAKHSNNIENIDVDYIFLFDIYSDEKNTIIDYSIALINMSLVDEFGPLSDCSGRLKGKIILDMIYSINE